jgi:hypothetical protein
MVYGLDPDANPGYGISAEGNAAIEAQIANSTKVAKPIGA